MKALYISAITILALSFTSCRKERTCECKITETTGNVTFTGSITTTRGYVTKKEAKRLTDCYSYTQTETNNGQTETTTYECELK
jgi:hypothetical protein